MHIDSFSMDSTDVPSDQSVRTGRYKVREKIAGGGMGQVYLADNGTEKVAIKVANPFRELDREAKFLASLANHPNIVRFVSFSQCRDTKCLAMEYVGEGTLQDVIEHGGLPLSMLIPVAEKLASAIDFIHHKGIVHGDIKPQNVLMSKTTPKIIDFGHASRKGDVTCGGTKGFVAPERSKKACSTPASDIYSLGKLIKACSSTPLPPEVQKVLQRATDRCPLARWRSAGEMVRAMKANMPSKTEIIHSPSNDHKSPHRLVFAMVAVGVMVATALVTLQSRHRAIKRLNKVESELEEERHAHQTLSQKMKYLEQENLKYRSLETEKIKELSNRLSRATEEIQKRTREEAIAREEALRIRELNHTYLRAMSDLQNTVSELQEKPSAKNARKSESERISTTPTTPTTPTAPKTDMVKLTKLARALTIPQRGEKAEVCWIKSRKESFRSVVRFVNRPGIRKTEIFWTGENTPETRETIYINGVEHVTCGRGSGGAISCTKGTMRTMTKTDAEKYPVGSLARIGQRVYRVTSKIDMKSDPNSPWHDQCQVIFATP